MKLLPLLLAGMAAPALAATITVTNINSPAEASAVIGGPCTGVLATSATIAIGSFSLTNEEIRWNTTSAILAGFHQFGNAIQSGFGVHAGLYESTVSGSIATGNHWEGKQVYTVVGWGNELGKSPALLVFQHHQTFVRDPGATPDVLLAPGQGAVIAGLEARGIGPFRSAFHPSVALACGESPPPPIVPEPSAALLLLAAGLMGLSRSRERAS